MLRILHSLGSLMKFALKFLVIKIMDSMEHILSINGSLHQDTIASLKILKQLSNTIIFCLIIRIFMEIKLLIQLLWNK
jgi:hypothetical protein